MVDVVLKAVAGGLVIFCLLSFVYFIAHGAALHAFLMIVAAALGHVAYKEV